MAAGTRLVGHRRRFARAMGLAQGPGSAALGAAIAALGLGLALVAVRPGVSGPDPRAPWWVVGVLGVAFAWGGLLVTASALTGMRTRAARRAAAAAHPGEPWLADHPWDPAGAEDDSRRRLAAALGLSGFLAVLLVPFHWVALVEPPGPFAAALWWGVVGLFDLVLASALIDVVRRLAHWLRFGASRVRFDRFPFFLGGTADLRVRLAPALAAAPGLTLRLRCVEERREGRPYRTFAYEVYGDTRTVEPSTLGGPGAELAASFPLPTGDLGTRLAADPPRYWELAARAAGAPWAGFEATFLVPVYAHPPRPA